MPDPGVSLIPRGSKSTKKRRTSFRPASKKSNQNKNKAAAASSAKAKAAAAAVSRTTEEASLSITKNAASRLDTPVTESAQEAIKNSTDQGGNQPLPPSTKASAPRSLSEEQKSIDDDNATTHQEVSNPTRTTRPPSMPAADSPSKTNPTNRKRKAHSMNKKISIGSSLRRPTEASTTGIEDTEKEGSEATPGTKDGEGKENLQVPKKRFLASAIATGHSTNVPDFSENDQAILNQLANEEGEADARTLTAFCTPFRGPKRKLKDNKENSSKGNNTNKNSKDTANEKGAKENAATADPKNEKVDATTNGAPSVQIVDGQIVLQESSVVLPSRRTVQEVEEEFRDNVVEEDEQLNIVQASYTSFLTKGDHGKTRKKGTWTIEETEKFYMALSQLGTDFGSMEALFFENQRTRKQLKNKYRKELAKNPDLVQELALNPKYQTKLDMAALSIAVDPKRIEAHENEEPPAYEPTDGDEVEKLEAADEKKVNNETGADYNGVFEQEVVEEDAEEERLAEARAKQRHSNATPKPSTKDQPQKVEEEDPFSSEVGERNGTGEEGPSMDDFFGDSYGDDGNEPSSTKKEDSATSSPTKRIPSTRKETSVSLVPKKANTKSRRPKIRPSRRKK